MEHLPPWLRNVPLPPRPAGYAADDEEQEAAPTWLRELQEEVDERPSSAPPQAFGATSWLQSLSQAEQEVQDVDDFLPAEPPIDSQPKHVRMPSGATDWLKSIGEESSPSAEDEQAADAAEAAEAAEAADSVPEWLRDVSPEELERDIASVSESEPREASFEEALPEPDWLPVDPPASEKSDAPDWLQDGDALPSPSSSQADSSIPTWLREIEVPPEMGGGRPPDEEVPDWLRADDLDQPEPAEERSDVPTWLREVSSEQDADDGADADVSAWLQSDDSSPAPTEDVGVPTWLRESDPPAPDAASAPIIQSSKVFCP